MYKEFKKIKCFNIRKGLYKINRQGVIINKDGLVMKQSLDTSGYPSISLMMGENPKGLKRKTFAVHRLVCKTFKLVQPIDKQLVNHKDGNKCNNDVSNLEWCTVAENNKHAYDTGLRKKLKGTKVGTSRYKEPFIEEICKLISYGNLSNNNILDELLPYKAYDYDREAVRTLIGEIRRKKRWTHISDKYF